MWYFYVYVHYKASDMAPFYVGKGHMRERGIYPNFERAYALRPHNKHWTRVVAKHGLHVEILACCSDDKEAQRVEREVISRIGRADKKQGPLINKTDGGDGHYGIIASPELRRKRSINSSGPRSEEFCIAIRKARKNGGNGGVVKKGDKLPESWCKNIGRALSGEGNPWYGKPNPALCKRVMNQDTGVVYASIAAAAEGEGYKKSIFYQYFANNRHRPSNFPNVVQVE